MRSDTSANGTTLVLKPGRQHPRASGIEGWLLRLAGFARQMGSLTRILVSHGEAIEANPQLTLRDLAGSLP